MNDRIDSVRQRLDEGKFTCVLLTDREEYTSYERGVKPLLSLLESRKSFIGAVAADKTVGAGAAHLYVLLGVRALWANMVITAALKVFKENGIEIHYAERVPYIINRKGDGVCPIETAVKEVWDSKEAYRVIVETLGKLAMKKIN